MQKAVFKQQFEAFKISNSEGLEKGYDRFQQLLSQLEAHGAEVSTEVLKYHGLRGSTTLSGDVSAEKSYTETLGAPRAQVLVLFFIQKTNVTVRTYDFRHGGPISKCAPFEMLYGRKCRASLSVWIKVGERVLDGPRDGFEVTMRSRCRQIREDLSYTEEPESILDRQVRVMRNKTIPFVKILWRNHPEREATWETEESIRTSYPHFLP
ncbi:DNA/RNA polymerases superfamily protein [Tanacetum coccineum]